MSTYDDWSQEASDNLRKIAEDAIRLAQLHPGQWVNPLEPHLQSRVRCALSETELQRFVTEAGHKLSKSEIRAIIDESPDGFFQHFQPRRRFLAGSPNPTQAARTLKSDWYDEIRALGDWKQKAEIIRLIKHTGGLQTDRIRQIKSWRCYIGQSPIPRFKRFVSADYRFPVAVSYPEQFSFFYEFSHKMELHVDWECDADGAFGISREQMAMSAQRGDRDALLFLAGKKDLAQYLQDAFAQREVIARSLGVGGTASRFRIEDTLVGDGDQAFSAKRLVSQNASGEYTGEWVCFVRARYRREWISIGDRVTRAIQQPMLWRLFNHTCLDSKTFKTFVSSFQWLSDEFFQSLPV
ncbi:MAG: hypothetical protein M5U01_19705 [Ardenticatenaceae bacterium]|nr:hypothetical protein [Ardenticatenaceae bacterium]